MGVVLDNNPGERVLLYGSDGSALVKILTTTAGLLRQTPHWTQVLTYAYAASPAPHGSTQRWVYTVPAGRIALLEALALVSGPTTAAQLASVQIFLARSGGAAQNLALLFSLAAGNLTTHLPYALALAAGDAIAAYTTNADVGAVAVWAAAYLREVTL